MKRLVLLIALLVFSLPSFCQSLSLDDLVKIIKLSPDEVNDFVVAKGWELSRTDYDGATGQNIVVWSVDENDNNESNYWLRYQHEINDSPKSLAVTYNTNEKKNYDAVMRKIKQYGMNKVASRFEKNGIVNTYFGANYAVDVYNGKPDGATTVYIIKVMDKQVSTAYID